MNYGELKTEIKDYMHRTDLDSKIPQFIKMVSSMINRRVLSPFMEKQSTETVTTQSFDVPTDYLKMRSITAGGVPLTQFTPRQGSTDDKYSVAGEPRYYSMANRKITLHPAPQADIEIVINYFARIPAFTDDTDEHLLLTNNPNIFIYGALREGSVYVQDEGAARGWGEMFIEEVNVENSTAFEDLWSGDPLVMQVEMVTP